jgi:hypothetical protein
MVESYKNGAIGVRIVEDVVAPVRSQHTKPIAATLLDSEKARRGCHALCVRQ